MKTKLIYNGREYSSLQAYYEENWYPGCVILGQFRKNINKGLPPIEAMNRKEICPIVIGNRHFRNALSAHSYLKDRLLNFYTYRTFKYHINNGKSVKWIIQRYQEKENGNIRYGFYLSE